jgi:hypothetical protein
MAAEIYNFAIEEGADIAYGIRLKENKIPQNLSEWTFKAQLRALNDTVIFDFDVEISQNDPYVLRIGKSGSVTDALIAGVAKHDLLGIAPDGRRFRLLEGQVTISSSVTEL